MNSAEASFLSQSKDAAVTPLAVTDRDWCLGDGAQSMTYIVSLISSDDLCRGNSCLHEQPEAQRRTGTCPRLHSVSGAP